MRRRYGIGTNGGRGFAIDDATGRPVRAQDRMRDVRQGIVDKRRADLTPGFGTHHPRDKIKLGSLNDPTPIPHARPGTPDADVEAGPPAGSITLPPRPGGTWPPLDDA